MTIGLKRLSCRTVVAMGAAFISLSYIVTSFVEDIRLFYITLGLCAGNVVFSEMMVGLFLNKHQKIIREMVTQ